MLCDWNFKVDANAGKPQISLVYRETITKNRNWEVNLIINRGRGQYGRT